MADIRNGGGSAAPAFLHTLRLKEFLFKAALVASGALLLIALGAFFVSLFIGASPAIKEFGFGFLWSKTWNPVTEQFGAFPFIVGTLLTAFVSLAVSFPFALSIAIALGEFYRKGIMASFVKSMTELLAGIPSVIYGFWGLAVLAPLIRELQQKFDMPPYGVGILTASIILSIMIIPYSASIAREIIELVPNDLKEAGYALGSTRYEVIRDVILPYAKSGIIAGVILSLGRALGETMAVTMLIGNSNKIPTSLLSPANTMSSVIANEFNEAGSGLHSGSLIMLGLILLVITAIINFIGKYIIKKTTVGG